MNKSSDEALVASAKHGDGQAFEELVLRHKRRVLAVAQRITNNREDAEDVAQESFHKAFLHLDNFQEKSRFSTWLTRIAMNQAFMLLRRKREFLEVLPENPDDDGNRRSEPFIDQSPTPEECCWRRERRDLLTKAIHRLSPIVGQTIVLRHIDEKSAAETAKILGTTIGAVKARNFHGRRRLRRIISVRLCFQADTNIGRCKHNDAV
jgi:RNA polymerase sigma-70 factor, ECF subfamily